MMRFLRRTLKKIQTLVFRKRVYVSKGAQNVSREKANRVADVMIARYDQALRALHDR